jgi:hypothetical protein
MYITNHDTATVTLPLERWDIIIDILLLHSGSSTVDCDIIYQVNKTKAAIELDSL